MEDLLNNEYNYYAIISQLPAQLVHPGETTAYSDVMIMYVRSQDSQINKSRIY